MIFFKKNTKIHVLFPGRVREEARRPVQRALREHAQVLLRLRAASLRGERASHRGGDREEVRRFPDNYFFRKKVIFNCVQF